MNHCVAFMLACLLFTPTLLAQGAKTPQEAQRAAPLAEVKGTGVLRRPESVEVAPFMTTPITVTFLDGQVEEGSGFYFDVFSPGDPSIKGPQWLQLSKEYVITNRHLIHQMEFDSIETLTFSLRRKEGEATEWVRIPISGKENIGKRLHMIRDSPVDVVAIDVTDLIIEAFAKRDKAGDLSLLPMRAISNANFPSGANPLKAQAGDDVIVIGYPRHFADEYNKLPILKRGMLITPWGMKYDGKDDFLIDYKGFHGDSGSLVISRPTDITVIDGQIRLSLTKEFIFMGVYSEEPVKEGKTTETDDERRTEKIRIDTGQVWYWYSVQSTIDSPPFYK